MNNIKLLGVLLATVLSGCDTLKNQDLGVGQDGVVSAHNNLDRHGAIALFQSQEGQACYGMIKQAIEFDLEQQRKVQPQQTTDTTQYDAFVAQSAAMERLATNSMKYASHMVAYSNGVVPQDPLVQLAGLCKKRGYYDWKTETQAERQKTYRSIVSDVKDTVLGVSPYAALGYVASKVGDTNNVSGNNSAVGDNNGVASPTVVDPVIVDPVVADPVIIEPSSSETPTTETPVTETPTE